MTKLCSVCGTENREEAQFCRACGTAFATIPGVRGAAENGANVCSECGFQNKPGLRYCANCGMGLAAASEGAGSTSASDADVPYSSPPPISYPSFAPVAPYPPAPSEREQPPDIPDPAAEIALLQQQRSDAASPFSSPAPANRAPLVVGGFAVLLVVAAVAAWIFMHGSNPAPPAVGTTPVVAVPAPDSAPATTTVIVEPATASAPPTAGASAVEPAPATPTAATTATSPLGAPPAAAAPLPQVTNPGETPEEEAKRLAAEKRRDKAAHDKAERDAKAKAAADQRDQSAVAAAQKAEQEAQAAQRTRQSSAAPAPPPPQPVAQAHGVREICAGRGTIAEAVCQSRQCGSAEHANEPICRQLREQDERRRNMQY